MRRRSFIKQSLLAGLGVAGAGIDRLNGLSSRSTPKRITNIKAFNPEEPIAVCTWNCPEAIMDAVNSMKAGSNALDGVVKGVAYEEANEENTTVGIGATPDREGNVTLDACVMDHEGNCGSVMAVQNIVHVAALARDVMQHTPHVILVGDGAEQFAYERGFPATKLLKPKAEERWREWLKTSEYKPVINIENHDTIGMLTMDLKGRLSGACTTSGMGYKMKGRVGDSPIIGAGLYVDQEVGAATSSGLGEEVIKTVGSFLIVELMRQGYTAQEACEEGVSRIIKRHQGTPDFQVAYLALSANGEIGAYSIHPGFGYTVNQGDKAHYFMAESFLSKP